MQVTYPNFSLQKPDFYFIFDGERFPVSHILFSFFSRRFLKEYSYYAKNEYNATVIEAYKSDFQTFIDACQARPYQITKENMHGLLYLCNLWKVDEIGVKVKEYINKQPNITQLLQQLRQMNRIGRDTFEYEEILSKMIPELLLEMEFVEIEPEILFRIFQKRESHEYDQHLLLCFLFKAIQHHGVIASHLFQFLDCKQLSFEELASITDNNMIETRYMRMSPTDISLQLISEQNRIKKELETLSKQFSETIDQQNIQIQEVRKEIQEATYAPIASSLSDMKKETETLFNKLDHQQSHIIKIEKEIQRIRTKSKRMEDQMNSMPYILKVRAQYNDPIAQFKYGKVLLEGIGVKQNVNEAYEFLRKSSSNGNLQATMFLADLLYKSKSRKNVAEAAELYKRAVEQGEISAFFFYGNCLRKGEGIQQNLVLATEMFKLGAEKGDFRCQNSYASALETGEGVMNKNTQQAFLYYCLAAEKGYPLAQYNAGRCYLYGIGTEVNYSKAQEYLEICHARGDKEADKLLKQIIDAKNAEIFNDFL